MIAMELEKKESSLQISSTGAGKLVQLGKVSIRAAASCRQGQYFNMFAMELGEKESTSQISSTGAGKVM
jgi:hypothetical protein